MLFDQALSALSGTGRKKRKRTGRQLPYTSDLDADLIKLSKKDHWSIRDAVAGCHIFGGNGSGKTSGSGQTLAKAYLKAGFGGLVLCAKPDERALWEQYARETGRDKHLIIVDDSGTIRFNFMHYEMKRPAMGKSGFDDHIKRVENLVSSLMNVLEQSGRDLSGSGDDAIWYQSAQILLRNALFVVSAVKQDFSLADLNVFIDDAPTKRSDVVARGFEQCDFAKTLEKAETYYRKARALEDFMIIKRYWTVQFPDLPEKTRGSVLFTLTALLQDLQTGTLRKLFTT